MWDALTLAPQSRWRRGWEGSSWATNLQWPDLPRFLTSIQLPSPLRAYIWVSKEGRRRRGETFQFPKPGSVQDSGSEPEVLPFTQKSLGHLEIPAGVQGTSEAAGTA